MALAKTPEFYDFAIIGSGLTGLLVAHALEPAGVKIALIESNELLGGRWRSVIINGHLLPSHFNLVKFSPQNGEYLKWLEQQVNRPVMGEKIESPPVTFEGGNLKPFIGFGSRQFSNLEILNLYNQSDFFQIQTQPHEWLESLCSSFVGEQFCQSVVTSFNNLSDGMEIHINGAYALKAKKVIFTSNPKHLLHLLPDNQISSRLRQKLAKARLWTTLALHFYHTQDISKTKALHFLFGNSENFDPSLGGFFNSSSNVSSLWKNFIDTDQADDSEGIANIFREMKKQIKKVYPDFFETVLEEKISVLEDSHGTIDLGLKEFGLIPEQPHLFLASHTQTGSCPLIGSLIAAQKVISWTAKTFPEINIPVSSLHPETYTSSNKVFDH